MISFILSEIWQKFATLGGIFYATLIILIILRFIFSRFHQMFTTQLFYTTTLALLITTTFSLFHFSQNLSANFDQLVLPDNTKISTSTFTIKPAITQIKSSLPSSATTCYLSTWDIPNRYALQLLYPQLTRLIFSSPPPPDCNFIISQFQPFAHPNYFLVQTVTIDSKSTYLYQQKNQK